MRALTLEKNEKILLILHRHWFVIVRDVVGLILIFIAGVFLFSLRDFLIPTLEPLILIPVSNLVFVMFILFLVGILFARWVTYYLDVWIVTTKRIIDIEQHGLFNREISEFLIARVQDVTIEIPGFISTMLNFGNITIQTAGERSFLVRDVPKLHKAKDTILTYSHKARNQKAI